MNWKSGFQVTLFIKLAREFKKRNIHIVHTHGWLSFLYGSIACVLAGIPILINGEHGTFNLEKKRRKYAYHVLSIIVDKYITVSNSLKKELVKHMNIDPSKIVVISNGVDTDKFCLKNTEYISDHKNKMGIPISSQVVGSVGRLEPVKNYEMFVNAFFEVTREFPTLHMLLIGDGSCKPEIKNLVLKLELSNKVHLLGLVNEPEDWISIMDIFVLTSYSEGMSNTILEAMSCSKPIVATDVGGNNELISEGYNGLLIQSGNRSELVEAIKYLLLNDIKRNLFGEHSRTKVEKAHGINVMVSKYENVYFELVKKYILI